MGLAGKVALVTGGGVRLGKAISLALADAGCHLLIHYGQSQAAALAVQRQAQTKGVRAEVCGADLAEEQAAKRVMARAVDCFGQVDILINNAAIYLPGDLAETTPEMWEAQFAINLRAPFLLCQAFAEQLPAHCQGKIVNIGDARVFQPATDHFAYRLTKIALHGLTEMLAVQLAPQIRVNAVALGYILPIAGEEMPADAPQQIPLQRVGNPQIVAENVLHLLQQEFLTGVVLKVDGGQFL